MTDTISATLQERGNRYGAFTEHARISQNIKKAMRDSPNWESLSPDKKEALEMNAHKTARILNGDPEYHDSWHDIEGYTRLVADELIRTASNMGVQESFNQEEGTNPSQKAKTLLETLQKPKLEVYYAWLVERHGVDKKTGCRTLLTYATMDECGVTYVTKADDALHFIRRIDAEKFAEGIYDEDDTRIVEHAFEKELPTEKS